MEVRLIAGFGNKASLHHTAFQVQTTSVERRDWAS